MEEETKDQKLKLAAQFKTSNVVQQKSDEAKKSVGDLMKLSNKLDDKKVLHKDTRSKSEIGEKYIFDFACSQSTTSVLEILDDEKG